MSNPKAYVPGYWIAMCHMGLGDDGAAIEWLHKAVDEPCRWRVLAAVDPKFDVIREDASFKQLLRSIGFVVEA